MPRTTLLLFAALMLGACDGPAFDHSDGGGGHPGVSFATQFCAKMASCSDASDSDCVANFSALVVTPPCQQTLEGASCADLSSPSPPASWQSCFPYCMSPSGTHTCNQDGTLTSCESSRTYVFECSAVCASVGLTYTGTCGTLCGAQTAINNRCCCR